MSPIVKTLILTEKPSVARDFAKALDIKSNHDGYIQGGDYTITWAVGHLVELLEPQDYDAKWKKWSLDTLPVIPDSFSYKPISKTRKQFTVIRKLLDDKTFSRIIVATDAGREGEVIARTILQTSGFNNRDKLFRFWSSLALTPQVVREEMASIQPLTGYDRLWNAGQSRQIADWLVGMNLTRAATVTMHDLFSVGRVQTAVLALIVDRRRERERFKPQPYWLLQVLFSNEKGTWLGTWFKEKQTRFEKKEDAERIRQKILDRIGSVLSVGKQKKKQPPPPLYSLTALQQDANKKYGFSAQHTLDIAQTLYEKMKCLSYPRTDSTVLGSKNAGMAKTLVEKLSNAYPQPFSNIDPRLLEPSNKRVFNDAKLTDHHALIPLAPIPASAGDEQKKIYDLVLKRFAAAFHPDCEYEQTEIITGVQDETFRTKGKRILDPGWRSVYGIEPEPTAPEDDEREQENLPPLQKNDPANVDNATLSEKKTTPPPDYTEALLLKDMTNPGKYVSEDDLKKIYRGDIGLGTQATRAQIIETLLKRKYVERKKKILLATDKGCHLIDTLRRFEVAKQLTSAEETARWEARLNRIAQGEDTGGNFLDDIREFVRKSVCEFQGGTTLTEPASDIGHCPSCGGVVIEGKKGFGCSNWKPENGGCTFVIWKDLSGKRLTPKMIHTLLTKKELGPLDGFVSEGKKTFSAAVKLVRYNGGWTVDLEKVKGSSKDASVLGTCPDCGGEIVEGKKGYGCKNWKKEDGGCQFVIWKTIAHKKIPKTAVRQLLKTGKSDVIEGMKSKTGTPFSARLKLQKSGNGPTKVVFDFPEVS